MAPKNKPMVSGEALGFSLRPVLRLARRRRERNHDYKQRPTQLFP